VISEELWCMHSFVSSIQLYIGGRAHWRPPRDPLRSFMTRLTYFWEIVSNAAEYRVMHRDKHCCIRVNPYLNMDKGGWNIPLQMRIRMLMV
jgi:hypothetical protein